MLPRQAITGMRAKVDSPLHRSSPSWKTLLFLRMRYLFFLFMATQRPSSALPFFRLALSSPSLSVCSISMFLFGFLNFTVHLVAAFKDSAAADGVDGIAVAASGLDDIGVWRGLMNGGKWESKKEEGWMMVRLQAQYISRVHNPQVRESR